MKSVDDAIIAKLAWNNHDTTAYAKALLETAVQLHIGGRNYFNNDDVPAAQQPMDKSTVGAVFRLLHKCGVIGRTGVHLPDKGILYGRRKSTRPECNGHENPLWTLSNIGIAMAWLKRNGPVRIAPVQGDLFNDGAGSTSALRAGL